MVFHIKKEKLEQMEKKSSTSTIAHKEDILGIMGPPVRFGEIWGIELEEGAFTHPVQSVKGSPCV